MSSCTDLLYVSQLHLIQTKVNLLKGDEMNILILIAYSLLSINFNMFFELLFFLILIGFILTISLYLGIKLKYKIIKDDVEIIIDECRNKIANS